MGDHISEPGNQTCVTTLPSLLPPSIPPSLPPSSSPINAESSPLFPAPVAPKMTVKLPGCTSKLTSRRKINSSTNEGEGREGGREGGVGGNVRILLSSIYKSLPLFFPPSLPSLPFPPPLPSLRLPPSPSHPPSLRLPPSLPLHIPASFPCAQDRVTSIKDTSGPAGRAGLREGRGATSGVSRKRAMRSRERRASAVEDSIWGNMA